MRRIIHGDFALGIPAPYTMTAKLLSLGRSYCRKEKTCSSELPGWKVCLDGWKVCLDGWKLEKISVHRCFKPLDFGTRKEVQLHIWPTGKIHNQSRGAFVMKVKDLTHSNYVNWASYITHFRLMSASTLAVKFTRWWWIKVSQIGRNIKRGSVAECIWPEKSACSTMTDDNPSLRNARLIDLTSVSENPYEVLITLYSCWKKLRRAAA